MCETVQFKPRKHEGRNFVRFDFSVGDEIRPVLKNRPLQGGSDQAPQVGDQD
jgi:hypothetical protein